MTALKLTLLSPGAIKTARKTVKSRSFQVFILASILLAGAVVGLETFPHIVNRYGELLTTIDNIVIWIFIGEFCIKLAAESPRPWRYFRNPWNVFDFCIIMAFFLPFTHQYALVLRLARILRVLKLIRAFPRLQILVTALLESIPSLFYVCLLLFILFYTYGVTATFLFAENDPVHFGTLPTAILSLFQIATLEGWAEIMYTQMYGCDVYGYGGLEDLCVNPSSAPVAATIFFTTFVLLGATILFNLFIGVMTNSLHEVHQQQQQLRKSANAPKEKEMPKADLKGEVVPGEIQRTLSDLQKQLAQIQASLQQPGDRPSA